MLQNYHTEISVCSSVNGMQCRRHNKKQWETEYKVRRTFTWQRANLLPVKKFVSLGLILPPHFSFQLSRTCTKSNSEYYSFKSKEQIIEFPPSFWKQIAVNKASVQIWIEFHGLQFICLGATNCRQLDWNIHFQYRHFSLPFIFLFSSQSEFDTDSATEFETFACLFINAKCFQ